MHPSLTRLAWTSSVALMHLLASISIHPKYGDSRFGCFRHYSLFMVTSHAISCPSLKPLGVSHSGEERSFFPMGNNSLPPRVAQCPQVLCLLLSDDHHISSPPTPIFMSYPALRCLLPRTRVSADGEAVAKESPMEGAMCHWRNSSVDPIRVYRRLLLMAVPAPIRQGDLWGHGQVHMMILIGGRVTTTW